MHGTAYVRNHLQGQATGCYVDHTKLKTNDDALITSYYLWLPYFLSLLYTLAKLPHSMWKRYFENNLISNIIGGVAGVKQNKSENINTSYNVHCNTNDNDDDVNENMSVDNICVENNKGGKKNKYNQQKNKKKQIISPKTMVNSFEEFRHNYTCYQCNFILLENFNIFTLLISILVKDI